MYQQRFFDNDAMPRAVLTFPKGTTLTQSQIDELKHAWEAKYQGAMNAGKLAILPDGGDLETLGSASRELDFTASRNSLRDAIREAFKVPKIVLGDTEGVNLANAETSYHIFMRDVVDHALGKISDALTRALATEFSERIVIRHDEIIPEAEDQLIGRLKELKQSLTIDEQRKLLGLAPLAGNRGNVFILGTSVYDASWKEIV
jgi:HK97 family phage portal protein